MVVAQAVLRGDAERFLRFSAVEHPLALQLGGSDPGLMAQAAALGERWGYDEINLNIGCPSDRVQSGSFGACLMREPGVVAACIRAIRQQTVLPVSVKTRIGIDAVEEYEFLRDFVQQMVEAGSTMFIVHARNAILQGLSPKENRNIPPLKYDYVYRLKQELPELRIILNGGVRTVDEVATHLRHVDGVMIGRQAYSEPWLLVDIDRQLQQEAASAQVERASVVRQMADYAEQELQAGGRLHHIVRHMLGLYSGQPGARGWRRFLVEQSRSKAAGPEILLESLERLG